MELVMLGCKKILSCDSRKKKRKRKKKKEKKPIAAFLKRGYSFFRCSGVYSRIFLQMQLKVWPITAVLNAVESRSIAVFFKNDAFLKKAAIDPAFR